ncbi:MAG: hypothetical protein SGPRY_000597 [Prymnesium sp.]
MPSGATEASPIDLNLTEDELEMTVEQYLKAQCARNIAALKRHMDSLIGDFHEEAKRAKNTLQEVAKRSASTESVADEESETAEGPHGESDALADAFALVGIRGCHAGRVMKLQPTPTQKIWSIGRVEDTSISLAGDDEVSSNHAQIAFERKQFKLMDLGSTNGTFATNGKGSTFKLAKKKNHVQQLAICMNRASFPERYPELEKC